MHKGKLTTWQKRGNFADVGGHGCSVRGIEREEREKAEREERGKAERGEGES